MSDPINPDRLTEAYNVVFNSMAAVDAVLQVEDLPQDDASWVVIAAARAVLEAPTAEWCETHESRWDRSGVNRACELALGLPDEYDWHVCKVGRVRLVAEDA